MLKKLILWAILIDFGALTAWAIMEVGFIGIFQSATHNAGTIQIFFDLVVCALLFCAWMVKDAKSRGINPIPWIIGTCLTGSFAPLVYLIIREHQQASDTVNSAQVA